VHDPWGPGPRCAGPDRRMRSRYERVPHGRALRFVGRSMPGPPPISWPTTLGADPSWTAVAHQPADRMRAGRCPNQRHVPRRPLRPAPRTARRAQSDRRDPTRPARRVLPHRPRPSPVPRARPGLATQALLSRAAPSGSNANSKRSTTRSPSNKPNQQNKPPELNHWRAGYRRRNRRPNDPAPTRSPNGGFTCQPPTAACTRKCCSRPVAAV